MCCLHRGGGDRDTPSLTLMGQATWRERAQLRAQPDHAYRWSWWGLDGCSHSPLPYRHMALRPSTGGRFCWEVGGRTDGVPCHGGGGGASAGSLLGAWGGSTWHLWLATPQRYPVHAPAHPAAQHASSLRDSPQSETVSSQGPFPQHTGQRTVQPGAGTGVGG